MHVTPYKKYQCNTYITQYHVAYIPEAIATARHEVRSRDRVQSAKSWKVEISTDLV